MMEFDEIVVKESPGLCRCCLSEGCYKDLGTEYPWMSENEVYADMLLECFDISITQHNEGPNGPSRLICEVCITRLRDACNFKKQVLESEKRFIDMVARGEFRPKVLIYQTQMKTEGRTEEVPTEDVEYLDDDIDFGDDEPAKSDETQNVTDSITAEPLPVKGKRGRPRKSADVKTVKKMKVLDEKPKTSKAVTKGEQNQTSAIEDMSESWRKDELTRLLAAVLENSTIIPFRWFSNKYMCFYCCCTFFKSSKFKDHMKEEHENAKITKVVRNLLRSCRIKLDVSDITCKLCPKKLQTFEQFLNHISEDHDFKFNKDISRCVFTFKLNDKLMSCCDCGEKFQFFGTLLKHVHKYHNRLRTFICEICGKGFVEKGNVDVHVKNVHDSSSRACMKCDKTFNSANALKKHEEFDHKNKLKCPKCPEILGSKYLKQRHLALVHDEKNLQFKCDKCPQVFARSSDFVRHNSRVHLKEKTVTCDVCGFKVFNNDLLKRHMVKHNASRPFECEFCKKTYSRKATLKFHVRIHTNDKRYVCKFCGKAFVQGPNLKLHLRVHHSSNDNSTGH